MTSSRRIEELARQALERLRPKAKSLIVTVYGDAVYPHGGSVWLGSIIRLVKPFGLNERIVRTSVFRLSREQWLTSSQLGRRSFYSVTEAGRHNFDAVNQRLYSADARSWDKQWTMVFTGLTGLEAEEREALRRELSWQGFGSLVSGVMLHPDPDQPALRQTLIDAGIGSRALVMRGSVASWTAPDALRDVISSCWGLGGLAADYNHFLETFRPLWRAMEAAKDLDPALCFIVRMLLVHGYRRVLLRDPVLPDELLATDWPGAAARLLFRNLYRLIQASSEDHLMSVAETAEGPLPAAAPFYYERFGGL